MARGATKEERKRRRGARAEEVGARTARTKARSSGKASTSTAAAAGRGGGGATYRELYAEAQRRDIKGRSSMDKAQLERVLGGRRGK
jgi:hypothetical protein